MAGHPLIDAYLAELGRRLPARDVDELADGLAETVDRHLACGLADEEAATAALAEFGDADTVVAAFDAQSPGRRAARALLASGPVVGCCWAVALVAGRAWTWGVPLWPRLTLGLVLLATVGVLAVAATGGRYRRTRLAAVAGVALLALDGGAVVALLALAPVYVWPMVLAAVASAVRLAATVRALPRLIVY